MGNNHPSQEFDSVKLYLNLLAFFWYSFPATGQKEVFCLDTCHCSIYRKVKERR